MLNYWLPNNGIINMGSVHDENGLKNSRNGLTTLQHKKQVIWRRNKVKELYVRNYSQEQISSIMRISQPTVSRDIDFLKGKFEGGIENLDELLIEENFKWCLAVDEQIKKLYDMLDDSKLDDKMKLKAFDMLLKFLQRKQDLNITKVYLLDIKKTLTYIRSKEEELKEKEQMLEAESEGRKMDWKALWLNTSSQAVF